MTDDRHYLGELMLMAPDLVPPGWMACDGQRLAISQNQALFSILGTRFGGDGTTNFGLPDLRGRIPMGAGDGPGLRKRELGDKVGSDHVALRVGHLPAHKHVLHQTSPSTAPEPGGVPAYDAHTVAPSETRMSSSALTRTGSASPVDITPPSLVMCWCICVDGVFPPSAD